MPIKAIVCDMDGTLLTADHGISPKTQELLLSLQQKGITLVLASGRSYLRLDARCPETEDGFPSRLFD